MHYNGWQLAAPKIHNPTPESVAVGVGYIAWLGEILLIYLKLSTIYKASDLLHKLTGQGTGFVM